MKFDYRYNILIKFYRLQSGYKQEEICKGICSRQTISRIENNEYIARDKTYINLFGRLKITKFDEIDDEKIFNTVDNLYELICDGEYNKIEELINRIKKFDAQNILLFEYKEVLDIIYIYYIERRIIQFSIIEKYLKLLEIYPKKLQYIIQDIAYKSISYEDRKLKQKMIDVYNFFPKDILSFENEINYMILQERNIDAAFMIKQNINILKEREKYDLVLSNYQKLLKIYTNIQPKHTGQIKNEIFNYIKQNKNNLSTYAVATFYYQLGIIELINGHYKLSLAYFNESSIWLGKNNLKLTNYRNFLYFKLENIPNQLLTYAINEDKEVYMECQMYKYFHLKKQVIIGEKKMDDLYSHLRKMIEGHKVGIGPDYYVLKEEINELYKKSNKEYNLLKMLH